MIRESDLNIEYGDVPDYGDEARNTVSDFEHDKIIATYMVKGSMKKVAKQSKKGKRKYYSPT